MRCVSASSRGSDGRVSSSRSGALSASGCEVGATPVVSTSLQLLGVGEDAGELPREQIALVGGERQPRQSRDALDFLGRQS